MFAARLLTAAALLTLFCGALLFLPNAYWSAFLLAGLAVASLEWAALAGYSQAGRWLFAGAVLASGLALWLLQFTGDGTPARLHFFVYWIAAGFWLLVAPGWLVAKWQVRNPFVTGIAGWIVLVPPWLALTALQAGPGRLLMLLGVVWVADSAAYVVGRSCGRHRLAPRVSPGKTWEGLIGACLAVAVYYALVWFIFGGQEPLLQRPDGMILFAAVMVTSVEGDLFESWMKRQAGAKDSGTLFPGHGGMLDRIDGLTASVPLAALWLYYFDAPRLL